MAAFLAVYLTIYGGLHTYWVIRVWRAWPRPSGLIWVLVAWACCMILAPIVSRLLERWGLEGASAIVSQVAFLWMAWVFWFFAFGVMMDGWNLAARCTPLPSIPPRTAVGILVCLIVSLSVWGLIEARRLNIKRIALEAPIAEPIRIVQVSDLHLGPNLFRTQWVQVIAALREVDPDLIVSTGDLVDTSMDVIGEALDAFASLQPRLGKWAVTGNHEFYPGLDETLAFHARAGFTMLRGETHRFEHLALSGVDDPAGRVMGQPCHLEETALDELSETFHILLKHQPRVAASSVGRFDLQLSGHVHAGQVFPFGLFTRLAYGHGAGLTAIGPRLSLYVSRGSGTWGPPLRVGAPPEITVIELIPKDPGASTQSAPAETPP